MTGKAYYITTLADWQRHAARFTNSHFIVLAAPAPAVSSVGAQHAVPGAALPQHNHTSSGTSAQNFSPAEDHVREAPSSLGGQGFLASSEAEGSPDISTRAERDPSGGRSFSSDIQEGLPGRRLVELRSQESGGLHRSPDTGPGRSDRREAPSYAQVHPQHVAEVRGSANRKIDNEPAPCTCPEAVEDSRRILVLIEADEGVHLSLDDDPAFEALPHPLAQKSISPAAQSALAPHGVPPGATTFDAAEALARVHPLLRHRVF